MPINSSKKVILFFCLLVSCVYTQAQTKEETVAYIDKLVSESKPEITDTDASGCKSIYRTSYQHFTENRFDASFKNDFNSSNNPSCAPHSSEFISQSYEQINYKYLIDSLEIRKLKSAIYSALVIRFSKKIIEKFNSRPGMANSFEITIPIDKVANVKRALLHLKELTLKEKDLFDN